MAVGYNPRIVTNGLTLSLDAGNLKNYNAGISTNWVDSVGGNNGTLVGGTYHTDGPFVGAGYVEFDGTGDYLQISSNVDFQFGTGDFTIEGWFYADSQPNNYQTLFSVGSYTTGILLRRHRSDTPSNDNFYINNTLYDYDESFFPLKTWVHIAVTRQSGAVNLWIDGVSRLSPTNTSNLTPTDDLYIGTSQHSTGDVWLGKISNFRIIKGTALYTSNFTPPTTLTAVTNTKLLTCQGNTITDASSSAHTITTNGDAAANLGFPASAFEFDGTDDYVNAPVTKTASCTFSCWAKTTALNGTPMLFNAGPNGSGPDLIFYNSKISWNTWDGDSNPFVSTPASVTDGNWHYYVVVNDASSNAKLYYDGELLGTATYRNASANTNLTIGGNTVTYQWNGSISSFQLHNKVLTAAEIEQNYNALKGRYA